MAKMQYTKLVCGGQFVAEVDVDLLDTDEGLSPYISLEDAYKLDDVCDALSRGDIELVARIARVFTHTPVAV